VWRQAAWAAILSAASVGASPTVYGVIPPPREITDVNILSKSPIPDIYDKECFIIVTLYWNPDPIRAKVCPEFEIERIGSGESKVLQRFGRTYDSMKRVSDYPINGHVGLNKISGTLNNFGWKPTAVKNGEHNRRLPIGQSWENTEGLVNGYEQPRAFQIGHDLLGNRNTATNPVTLINQRAKLENGSPDQSDGESYSPFGGPFIEALLLSYPLCLLGGFGLALAGVQQFDRKRRLLGASLVGLGFASALGGAGLLLGLCSF
jgi:hypothetical protein